MLRITKFMLKDLEIQGLFSFLPKCVRTIFILEASSFSLYLDSSIDCSSLKEGRKKMRNPKKYINNFFKKEEKKENIAKNQVNIISYLIKQDHSYLIKQSHLETNVNNHFDYYHCAIFSSNGYTYDIFIAPYYSEMILKISSIKTDTFFTEQSEEFKILAEALKKHSFLRVNQLEELINN